MWRQKWGFARYPSLTTSPSSDAEVRIVDVVGFAKHENGSLARLLWTTSFGDPYSGSLNLKGFQDE